ncbi:C40 family peptidase [Hungatella hathewayi]|uniref:C40 family peptidase n=1 Tax=Hungatella hathewayi TaxID=154046 RepID=UPI003561CE02
MKAVQGILKRLRVSFLYVTFCATIQEMMEEELSDDECINTAIHFALSKLAYPYSQSCRNSGSAFDCSSLVYYSYLEAGVDISNDGLYTAAEIAKRYSDQQVSIDEIEPGDIIFYSNSKNGRYKNIGHMALYAGQGTQVEASISKKKVVHRPTYYKGIVMVCRPVM